MLLRVAGLSSVLGTVPGRSLAGGRSEGEKPPASRRRYPSLVSNSCTQRCPKLSTHLAQQPFQSLEGEASSSNMTDIKTNFNIDEVRPRSNLPILPRRPLSRPPVIDSSEPVAQLD